jgi:hypothetical protein
MPTMNLGPFTLGVDNVSLDTNMPAGTLRVARDVVIDRAGQVAARGGRRRVLSKPGLHSGWTSRDTGLSLCVDNGVLSLAAWENGALALTALGTVGSGPMSYCDLNGEIIGTNGLGLWRVTPSGASATLEAFGLPKPAFTLAAAGTGGLFAGKYTVAVTFLRSLGAPGYDEESAASDLREVAVAENGGLTVAVDWPNDPRITGARIYRSGPNGGLDSELLRAARLDAGAGAYTLGAGTLGDVCRTLFMAPMPAGSIVRYWRGRLLVAAGNVMYFSEPMYYGLRDARFGFFQTAAPIGIMEPVESGIFIGTRHGIGFLQGDEPKDLRWIKRGAGIPVAGTGTRIPAVEFGADLGGRFVDQPELDDLNFDLALWFSDQGLAIGLPDGQVREPQSGRLKLDNPAGGVLGWHGRRMWMANQP